MKNQKIIIRYKYIFSIILLIALMLTACGTSSQFYVKDSDSQEIKLNYGSADISFSPLYEENFGIRLIMKASSRKPIKLYPYSLKIMYAGEELICDIMRNQRLVVENPIIINEPVEFIGYSCNENFRLEVGDEVIVYGDDFIKENNRFFNLDTLYFELK